MDSELTYVVIVFGGLIILNVLSIFLTRRWWRQWEEEHEDRD